MDALFLCSNAFCKTLEPASSIKPRTSTSPRRKANVFHCNKGPHSFTVCCSQGSSSPIPKDDEERPLVSADWRSFRARLVATEKASMDESSPTIPIGEKWVHSIHEPEKGCLLIATEKLDGVHIFEKTVVLLLSLGPIGPIGIILNRPSLMSIKEIKSSSALNFSGVFSDRSLFFGGPLEEGLFLLGPKDQESNDSVEKSGVFEEVMKGLYYGSKESVGCADEMVKRSVVEVDEFRFFDGYCAWEKEQLSDEIRAGYWTVAACSPSVIGLATVGSAGLWEEVLGLMGPRKVW